MTEWNAIALVVEPPISVANALLEEGRRLAERVAEASRRIAWTRPHRFAAPVAQFDLGPVADLSPPDVRLSHWMEAANRVLESIASRCEETPVTLEPVSLVEFTPESAAIVSRLAAAPGTDLSALFRAVAQDLADSEFVATPPEQVFVTLGSLEDLTMRDRVRQALEGQTTPVSGWTLGGLCLARGVARPPVGLVEAERVRFVPFRKGGPRRGES